MSETRHRGHRQGLGSGMLDWTRTLQAGQSRTSAPATGSKQERAGPEQSVAVISCGMLRAREAGAMVGWNLATSMG